MAELADRWLALSSQCHKRHVRRHFGLGGMSSVGRTLGDLHATYHRVNIAPYSPDSQTMNPSNTTGKAFTGTSIFLQAPENLRTAFSDENALDETTWKICVVVIPNAPQENVTATEDGTCSIMSSQCVSDLQQGYADKFSRNQDCYGTPPTTPSSCGDAINTGNFTVQRS